MVCSLHTKQKLELGVAWDHYIDVLRRLFDDLFNYWTKRHQQTTMRMVSQQPGFFNNMVLFI